VDLDRESRSNRVTLVGIRTEVRVTLVGTRTEVSGHFKDIMALGFGTCRLGGCQRRQVT
jgi:hypothetical protein